jgi:hypothetical protein
MGRQPRFYSVTIISDGQPRSAAHTDRQIRLKAHGQLKNGSGRAGEHPIPILAVEKAGGAVLDDLVQVGQVTGQQFLAGRRSAAGGR